MSKPRQITITRPVTVEVMVAVPSSGTPVLSKEACVFALAGGVEMGVTPPWIEVQSAEKTFEPGVVLDVEPLPVAEPFPGESTFLVGDRVIIVPDDAWTLGRRPPSSVRPSKREAGLGQAEKGYFSIDEAAAFVSCSTSHIRRQVTRGTLPVSNIGTNDGPDYRISREDLLAWMSERKAGAKPPPCKERKQPALPVSPHLRKSRRPLGQPAP